MLPLASRGDRAHGVRSVCRTVRSYGRGVPEVRLAPMSDQEYAEFRQRSEVSYAAEIAASRAVPISEARRQAAEDHERLLPNS